METPQENNTGQQSENKPSKTEHLQPWQFKKGQSGNPSGRPKGTKSLKEYAKEMLATMSEEERQEFMNGLSKADIWRMAEGNPDNKTDLTTKGEKITTLTPEQQALIEDTEAKLKESYVKRTTQLTNLDSQQ